MTIGSLWLSLVDLDGIATVIEWPPDVFALVDEVLDASEAYRFVVSPQPGSNLAGIRHPDVAAAEWWEWLEGTRDAPPEPLSQCWKTVLASLDLPVDALSDGAEWPVTEALLSLHAVADEACAGLGSPTAARPGPGCMFRAAGRELLAETGSVSRLPASVVRVLPRCRTSSGGMSIHSLSRHVSVHGPQVDVDWHRIPSMPTGVRSPEAHVNGVLLPWPLRVRSRDFHSVPYLLPHMDPTDTCFFTFDPAEPMDFDLVAGVLRAAIDEAGTVNFLFLPEQSITPDEIAPLEELAARYGVWCLAAGVRDVPADGSLGRNWVHVGVRQDVQWRHATQHKHHRWRLDQAQIAQYHLGGALMPTMSWWEAISIPRRSLQVIDQGAVTIVPLVCENLVRPEPVAELVRSVGPSLVVTLLLDGPQLSSRWTARYASVLADDPGSAVCALTSYGMARRCRPPGCGASRVVALWKDTSGRLTEIELEDGAQAVLVATNLTVGTSSTADGRRHPATTTTLTLAGVQSLRAEPGWGRPPAEDERAASLPPLDEREVSKATGWAEALAEAVVAGPDAFRRVLAAAVAGDWRAPLGLPRPTRMFERNLAALAAELPDSPTVEDLFAAGRLRRSAWSDTAVAGTVIQITLEQRLIAEVRAGRLSAEALSALSAAG